MKVLDDINKKFGPRAAFKMGEESTDLIPAISTRSLRLDMALGIGGVPRGRVIEIYGPESSGKTTLCQHIIAEAQAMGGICAFVDVEHAMEPYWAQVNGVNVDELILSQPDTGEQALEITEMYIRSREIDVVVVDSVAALVPKAEIEGEMGDAHMALQARLMSQALRKLSGVVKQSNCCLIFTNQIRQKIGVMFGNPETTTGGMALRFYASVRIDLRKTESIKDKDEIIGNGVKATIRKNKVSPPFKIAEFEIRYDSGIDRYAEIIEYAINMDIIDKKAAYYSMGEERLAQGKENLRSVLKENKVLYQSIEDQVRIGLGLPIMRGVK